MSAKQIIVTGCPRSGSRKLHAAIGQTKLVRAKHEEDADITISSALAVDADRYVGGHEPYWNRPVDEVWHLVRNPLDCIPSMADRVPSRFWIWQHEITGLHPRDFRSRREFAAYFWVHWNREADQRQPAWRLQIERLEDEWGALWARLGFDAPPPIDPRSDEYRGRDRDTREMRDKPRERLSWDELKSWGITIHDRIRRLADEYGYEED